jgi:hypothetical protein
VLAMITLGRREKNEKGSGENSIFALQSPVAVQAANHHAASHRVPFLPLEQPTDAKDIQLPAANVQKILIGHFSAERGFRWLAGWHAMVCLRCGRGEATQAREEEMCLAGWLRALRECCGQIASRRRHSLECYDILNARVPPLQ